MNRRSLIKRFAAIAAAVTVAPAVKAEAAPSEVMPTLMPDERWMIEPATSVAEHLYCAGCDEVFHTRAHKAEHFATVHPPLTMVPGLIPGTPYPVAMLQGLNPPPLTFEAMAQDCAARGCRLERYENALWRQSVITHTGFGGPAYQVDDYEMVTDGGATLARVDAWRRGLHEQDGPQMDLGAGVWVGPLRSEG